MRKPGVVGGSIKSWIHENFYHTGFFRCHHFLSKMHRASDFVQCPILPSNRNLLHLQRMNLPTLAQWQRGLAILENIVQLENELAALIGKPLHGSITIAKAAPAAVKKKSKMSAKARALISAAQKLRWAKVKAAKAPVSSKTPATAKVEAPVKRRTMSPAVKAKLAAAMKARWAAAKAGTGPLPNARGKK